MSSLQSPLPKATSDTGFRQEPFQLRNQYEDDTVLQNILKRIVPASVLQEFEPDLSRFGERVVNDILELGNDVETPSNYPRLVQYDAWCRRVDKITTAHGWEQLNRVAAEEGLVGIAYERKYNEYSRVYQFAKQYLYSPSSAVHSCPISMSDGAARALELLGTEEMKNKFYERLVSRDPNQNWTSGQWMTERPGGSDVGRTETIAELIDEKTNTWNVTGFKWFSSATTADMTMLLARTVDPKTGKVKPGSKGLSLYVAEMRNPDGSLNGVRVHRLKDKFGTKGLPTAELELTGMKAQLVGDIGRGVPCISSILNITRVYAAAGVASAVRRALAIAKDYATRREAFSRPLDKIPLHITTLAQLELVYRATVQITFFVVSLLGRTEALPASQTKQDKQLLRFLTPITKAYVCKIGVQAISEAMEALGGQGYMEETGLGREYRNSQVNTIWEGTTNVLAMDVVRVLRQTKGDAYKLFEKALLDKIAVSSKNAMQLEGAIARVRHALVNIRVFIETQLEAPLFDASARDMTFALGRVLAAVLLIEQASWAVGNSRPEAEQDIAVAIKWTLDPEFVREIKAKSAASISQEAKIVFGPNARL